MEKYFTACQLFNYLSLCSCINNKSQYFIVYFIWFYSVPKKCLFWKSNSALKSPFSGPAPCPFEILAGTLSKRSRQFLKEWKQNRPWLVKSPKQRLETYCFCSVSYYYVSQITFGGLLFLLRFLLLLLLFFFFLSVHHELVHGRSLELQDRI